MIRALHHVQLAAPKGSEPLLRDFYVGVLGLREVSKPPKLPNAAAPGSGATA